MSKSTVRDIMEGICVLLVALAAITQMYAMQADIERLQAHNRQVEARISELLQVIEQKTHPAAIQKGQFDWILREE